MLRRARREVAEFAWDFLLFLAFIWDVVKQVCYRRTLPLTRRLLSRIPGPPIVKVQDVRANRIRLDIASSYSSLFNVEVFEVEWAVDGGALSSESEWTSVGFSDLEQRTVARLKADTRHRFRVRAKSDRGIGPWCGVVVAKSRQEPTEGGGHGPGYVWTQTAEEIILSFELPSTVTRRDIVLTLKSDHLRVVAGASTGGPVGDGGGVLMDGELYGKVQTFDNGSVWEMERESGKLVLTVSLEKRVKSMAPKFDYWRSVHPGTPGLEIDTHKIASQGTGMRPIQPGQMDPQQLRSMGLGRYAAD